MCFELDVDGIASAADIALDGGGGGTSFCSQLGGVASCSRLCESLGSDACWDSYLRVLAGDPRFGSTLESWLVLQHASDRCHAAGISGRAVSCGDWSRLSPLQPAYRLDVLCAPSCVWPRSLAPAALDLINSTLPHADKATFCSRRADNTYCAALAASSSDACALLRDGCALYYEAHYLAFIGDAEAFARERDACERAHTQQTAFEPVPVALTPLGDATLSEIWHSTRSVVSQLDSSSSSSSGASSSQPSSSSAAAASFSRVLYNVTIDSTSYTASGLLGANQQHSPNAWCVPLLSRHDGCGRYAALRHPHPYHHPRSFRTMEHTLLATLTQLGYTVLAPDDLGIGSHNRTRPGLPQSSYPKYRRCGDAAWCANPTAHTGANDSTVQERPPPGALSTWRLTWRLSDRGGTEAVTGGYYALSPLCC